MKVEKRYPHFRIGDMVFEEMDEESPSQADFYIVNADFYIVKGIDKKSETYELYPVTFDNFYSRTFSFEYAHKWMKRTNNEA